MKKTSKYQKKTTFKPSKKVIVLSCVAGLLLALLIGMLVVLSLREEPPVESQPTTETTAPTTTPVAENTDPTEESTETIPEETGPVMLDHMAKLYAENPDIFAWITIEGTKVDYPLMYTPNENMKYLYKDFQGKYDPTGLPFIDNTCSVDPESTNIIIHGHNMNSGAGFSALLNYEDQKFYEEHPVIILTTLYEERTYEIVAAFFDRLYHYTEECFKFYRFVDAHSEEEFNVAAEYYRANNLLDTGVEIAYGDQLITLATCSKHEKDGRFVVVARLVTDDTATNP